MSTITYGVYGLLLLGVLTGVVSRTAGEEPRLSDGQNLSSVSVEDWHWRPDWDDVGDGGLQKKASGFRPMESRAMEKYTVLSRDRPLFHVASARRLKRAADDWVQNINFTHWKRDAYPSTYLVKYPEALDAIAQYYIEKGKPLYYIVHGLSSSGAAQWVVDMKNAILKEVDSNVLLVSWPSGTLTSFSRVELVGAEVAKVTTKLVTSQAVTSGAWITCIGHSLGAHVCGRAGRIQKMGRISALDPAILAGEDGLRISDADYVDVIHTDSSTGHGLGLKEAIGHTDFYPNAGVSQPGCSSPTCSHSRAHQYYIESIRSDCFAAVHKCSDYNDIPKSCAPSGNGKPYTWMGFHADDEKASGIYYLTTRAGSPYCQGVDRCDFQADQAGRKKRAASSDHCATTGNSKNDGGDSGATIGRPWSNTLFIPTLTLVLATGV